MLCGGRVLSYRQLDEASNAFARRLTDLGVGPEQTVAVITGAPWPTLYRRCRSSSRAGRSCPSTPSCRSSASALS